MSDRAIILDANILIRAVMGKSTFAQIHCQIIEGSAKTP